MVSPRFASHQPLGRVLIIAPRTYRTLVDDCHPSAVEMMGGWKIGRQGLGTVVPPAAASPFCLGKSHPPFPDAERERWVTRPPVFPLPIGLPPISRRSGRILPAAIFSGSWAIALVRPPGSSAVIFNGPYIGCPSLFVPKHQRVSSQPNHESAHARPIENGAFLPGNPAQHDPVVRSTTG